MYEMSVSEDLVFRNAMAKKIQKVYKSHYLDNIRKEVNSLKLSEYAKENDFDTFCRKMRNKDVVVTIKKYLQVISQVVKKELPITHHLVLSCYLIKYYSDEVLGNEKQLHQSDKDIIAWCEEIVFRLDNGGIDYKKQFILLKNFGIVFNQWKNMDKHRTIEKIIISYYNRNEHMKVLVNDENMNKEQKKDSINEIQRQMDSMLFDIKRIDNNFDINYLKENIEKVYKQIQEGWIKMTETVARTYKKAYYDLVEEKLKSGDSKPAYDLLVEICDRLVILAPKIRKESLQEKLNKDDLVNYLAAGNWTSELVEFLKFLVDFIIMLGAAGDDKLNMEWRKSIDIYFELDFAAALPKLLIEMQEKIDRIFQLIVLYNEKMSE